MLRLNTAIAAQTKDKQNRLGVIGGDTSGFPNGRRPGDDVVDIELRVAMGLLCTIDGVNTAVGCKASDAKAGTIDLPTVHCSHLSSLVPLSRILTLQLRVHRSILPVSNEESLP